MDLKIAHFGSKHRTFSILFCNMVREALFSMIFLVFRRLRPLILLAWPMFLKDFHVFAISLRGSKKHPKIGQKSLKNSKKSLNFFIEFLDANLEQFWSHLGSILEQIWSYFESLLAPFGLHFGSKMPPWGRRGPFLRF